MVTGTERRIRIMTLQEQIQTALNQDLDLTEEEYKEKMAKADKATAKHGIKGKAALTLATRYKRMSMNYYGTSLNLSASLLSAVDYNNKLLEHLIGLLTQGEKGEDNGGN